MTTNDPNRAEYDRRVNRALDYIRAHRAEVLTLDVLADVAAFSRFHFHRVFKAVTGENVMEHIQRVRLEAAASALITRPHADVLSIALDNGFTSASVFARAFKERFGMSATAWRKVAKVAPERVGDASNLGQYRRNGCQPDSNVGKAGVGADGQAGPTSRGAEGVAEVETTVDITVQNLPRYRVAYLRNIGPYGPGGGVAAVWERLTRWATSRDLWTADRIGIGVGHDNPHVTDPAKCRYDAAIVIADDLVVDGDVSVTHIEGGKYAVARFEGAMTSIGEAYDHIFGRWLPGSGYQPDERPMFERYRADAWDATRGTFVCDVCVPVRPL